MNFNFVTRPLGSVPSGVINQTLARAESEVRLRLAGIRHRSRSEAAKRGVQTRRENIQRRQVIVRKAAETRQANREAREKIVFLAHGTSRVSGEHKQASKLNQRARRAVAAGRNGWQF